MITQFDIYNNNTSNAVANVNIGYPRAYGFVSAPILQGTGSLQFEFLATGLKTNLRPGSQIGFGLRIGEVRSLIYSLEQAGTSGAYAFGMYCMGDESNLSLGLGQCYLLKLDTTTNKRNLSIIKSTSGVGLSSFQTLSALSISADHWAANTNFTMAFSWRVSGIATTLIGKMGTLTDYSDLSTVICATDTTSAFVSTIGEGFWGDSGTRNGLRVIWDYSQWAGRA